MQFVLIKTQKDDDSQTAFEVCGEKFSDGRKIHTDDTTKHYCWATGLCSRLDIFLALQGSFESHIYTGFMPSIIYQQTNCQQLFSKHCSINTFLKTASPFPEPKLSALVWTQSVAVLSAGDDITVILKHMKCHHCGNVKLFNINQCEAQPGYTKRDRRDSHV